MKRAFLVVIVIAALLPFGCSAQGRSGFEKSKPKVVMPYQDVRRMDLQDQFSRLNEGMIQTLWFNGTTIWPGQFHPVADSILEKGKNPGLGVRKLHEQGITGKGVRVAIIDQNICVDHPEYAANIVKYYDVGTNLPPDKGSMHGPAVASLLVGQSIGTAPGAKLYFVATPAWNPDAQYQADALNWIIEENEKLPANDKIRVVSISAAPSGPDSPFNKNNDSWDTAYDKATRAGILVLDCTTHHGITTHCYYDLSNPDDITRCIPGRPGEDPYVNPKELYIPTSRRTQAEEYIQGNYSYQYCGKGGLSWSIPYLAGVFAMGWQIRPDLTGEEMISLAFKSASIRGGNCHIINPPAFIEAVRIARKAGQ